MVQIRNVPDDLHRRLKARAALAGMSLSDYLLAQVRASADLLTPDEMRARLATRAPVQLDPAPAEIIRQERDRG